METINLTELEKGLLQILLARGLMEDAQFGDCLRQLQGQLIGRGQNAQNEKMHIFRNINSSIRKYSLEIKTVVDSSKQPPALYHGVVNLDDDVVAKLHGIHLESTEVTFAGDLLRHLVLKNMSTTDIHREVQPGNWQHSQTDAVLDKLYISHWIGRTDAGYWKIGLRSHLELRLFIETIINDVEDDNTDTQEGIRTAIDALPQILIY